MTGDTIASLLYLVLLLTVIGGAFFMANRPSLGQTARQLGVWALIFVGLIAVYGLWEDIRGEFSTNQAMFQGREITVPRQPDGHFYLTLDINEAPIRFVVDTGATEMVLSRRDAAQAGLNLENLAFFGQAMTANGPVDIARVTLDTVALGPLLDRDVRATVNGGELGISLLGMSYLNRFEAIQIQDGELTLIR